jgi:hypothetical protein
VVVPKHGNAQHQRAAEPRRLSAWTPLVRRSEGCDVDQWLMEWPYSDDSCAQVTCTFSGVAAGRSPRSVVQVSPVCLPPGGV